jgi:hypothetical protein
MSLQENGGPSFMASKSSFEPGEAAHLYRYRTPVLVGPWRKSARQAVLDALHAHQARRDERERETVHWLVPGRIEEMEKA